MPLRLTTKSNPKHHHHHHYYYNYYYYLIYLLPPQPLPIPLLLLLQEEVLKIVRRKDCMIGALKQTEVESLALDNWAT